MEPIENINPEDGSNDTFQALNEQKGKNPFQMPEGYLDQLEVRIAARIAATPTAAPLKPGIKIPMKAQLKHILVWAACFIGFAVGIRTFLNFFKDSNYGMASSNARESAPLTTDSYALYYVNQSDLINYLADNDDINIQ